MEFDKRNFIEHSPELVIGEATPVKSDQVPPGYSLWERQVELLNGKQEPAYYSTHEAKVPDPAAWERMHEALEAGFRWALTTHHFADHETEDDDRTQEIGNMISYALSQGLTEDEVLRCYTSAYHLEKAVKEHN